jgi:molybdopterin-binding protein
LHECRIAEVRQTGLDFVVTAVDGCFTEAGKYISLVGMTLSARNQLKGTVEEIQLGGVMAHVVVRVGENLIESVITRRSAEEMALKKGDPSRS